MVLVGLNNINNPFLSVEDLHAANHPNHAHLPCGDVYNICIQNILYFYTSQSLLQPSIGWFRCHIVWASITSPPGAVILHHQLFIIIKMF